MPFLTVEDDDIRAGLHTDILTALPTLTAVYDDREECPTDDADLPYALIVLTDPEIDEEYSSLIQTAYRYPYEIVIRGVRPGNGTLRAAKNAVLSALGNILCAAPAWRGYNYKAEKIGYGDEEEDAAQQEMTCSLHFTVWGNF